MQGNQITLCVLLSACASEPTALREAPLARETIELETTKLIIEHNATDEDTGFQGFVDGAPWRQLEIHSPDRKLALDIAAKGNLRSLGLTELFFETNEPENAEVPIADLLATMPAGDYDFRARTIDGLAAEGVATLSHTIPAAPEIVEPAPNAAVSAESDLVVRWNAVTRSLCDEPVTITHYELIVEVAEQPDGPGFGSETYDVHVAAMTTSLRVPHEFLRSGTAYKYEVLAIEARGNQTLSAGTFSTL